MTAGLYKTVNPRRGQRKLYTWLDISFFLFQYQNINYFLVQSEVVQNASLGMIKRDSAECVRKNDTDRVLISGLA